MQRLFVLIALGSLCFFAHSKDDCVHTEDALRNYEARILNAAADFKKHTDSSKLLKITEPLSCILEIQEKSSGWLQYLANSFLRPIFGGAQIQGVPKDDRYAIIARELAKITQHSPDILNDSVVAAHSRGAWNFYKLFCEQGDIEYCVTFLPDEEQIKVQSPLLAASSMLMLRKAYSVLKGKQKEEVADRIRRIYDQTPAGPDLKRRVIEQIYSELFLKPTLSFLS